jgi:hypothetical protein
MTQMRWSPLQAAVITHQLRLFGPETTYSGGFPFEFIVAATIIINCKHQA